MSPYLACSDGPVFGSRLYLCARRKRHFVRDGAIVAERGFVGPAMFAR